MSCGDSRNWVHVARLSFFDFSSRQLCPAQVPRHLLTRSRTIFYSSIEFLLASFVAIAALVFASGLVGKGEPARIVLTCTGVAGVALFVIRMLRREGTDDRDTAPPAIA
jgi:hypothetical protein